MNQLKHILVVLDPDKETQPALGKAIFLAGKSKAKITLLLCAYNRALVTNNFFNSEQLDAAKQGFLNTQKTWIKAYKRKVEAAEIECDISLKWHKPLYEGVIDKATELDVDLVLKSTHEHPTINKLFFTPNDWQLLKLCPIPIILAKADSSKTYDKIFAAIDVADSDDSESESKNLFELNQKILSSSQLFSNECGAELGVIHCFEPIGYQLWSDIGFGMGIGMGPTDFAMGDDNYDAYMVQLKKTLNKNFSETLKAFELSDEQKVLSEGYPEQELPLFVKENDVDLLVLGATYHSGLVGSTTEKILDQLNCDVLSVGAVNQ